MMGRLVVIGCTALCLLWPRFAIAQNVSVDVREGLSLSRTMEALTGFLQVDLARLAEALVVGTTLEVATAPLGTSSGGFTFSIDPATNVPVRSAQTFGPSFAQRALTAGAGKLSLTVNAIAATYDNLGSHELARTALASATGDGTGTEPIQRYEREMSLVLSSSSLVIATNYGATDDLDVGVAVPIVQISVEGRAWESATISSRGRQDLLEIVASGSEAGLGDVALMAKYRFLRFGPKNAAPDPGGIAALVTTRLPTGDVPNLRGLGVTRTMASIVASFGTGRIHPHVNAGYEWWSKAVDFADFSSPGTRPFRPLNPLEPDSTPRPRHQMQYIAGVEVSASPQLTLLLDLQGRYVRNGGRLIDAAIPTTPAATAAFGLRQIDFIALDTTQHLRKLTLMPGLKWNIKGNLLLALNAMVALQDDGLHDKFTPVVGLDWSF